jgi:hypothetical protein
MMNSKGCRAFTIAKNGKIAAVQYPSFGMGKWKISHCGEDSAMRDGNWHPWRERAEAD